MFTGLIQDLGRVERVIPGGMTDLWIHTSLGAASFELGESIAVNGACLTVVERTGDSFRVQAAPETLRRTTLGAVKPGDRVNLERALALGARLGGHLVSGHVDAVSEVLETYPEGGSWVMGFRLPEALAPYFIEKGSVAIDGISLTVNTLEAGRFRVQLIPETQERTTLKSRGVGAKVNLEADQIGKYVARLFTLQRGQGAPGDAGGLTAAAIKAAGFGTP
ncbi:riboflavin synthase [Corallococcus macrosporus]|uniref:Riboflavin synthase n=1 Tax=Myxococcus fulvus (strain ATCC BAA-855 / HW-1) TaxID=483219 RepID=F8C8A7_MYXFH|nr:riboflavin synthase [Corallococcus macrosporus]AEI68234.1 riboflavin synthase subunit alpha [Corallococcus macrosporus]